MKFKWIQINQLAFREKTSKLVKVVGLAIQNPRSTLSSSKTGGVTYELLLVSIRKDI